MKTKTVKAKNKPPAVAAVETREPTDAELRALEAESPELEAVTLGAIGSTPVNLAQLGLNQIAYVRRAVVDDQQIWSIHSAAGHPLGAAPTFEQAWGAVVQNELVPMYVN
jgi:hypothetical protein